jgi:lysophospholipid acyltransferase (LPLAT)-like uncharacterized protein
MTAQDDNMVAENTAGSFKIRAQGRALSLYVRLVSATARFSVRGLAHRDAALSSGAPVLFACWHQQLMTSFQYGLKEIDIANMAVIVAGDERGDTLGALGRHLGLAETVKVDMGGNPVLAGRRVLHLVRRMQSGMHTLMAPDGPDGPAFVLKEGAAFIAQRAGAVVVPFGAFTRHGLQLNRWDRYLLPLPYARVHVVFDRPIAVADMELSALMREMTGGLNRARAKAMALVGGR